MKIKTQSFGVDAFKKRTRRGEENLSTQLSFLLDDI